MNKNTLINRLSALNNGIAILIDPDKQTVEALDFLMKKIQWLEPDFIFIGGSTVDASQFKECIKQVRERTQIQIVIFPGSSVQWDDNADAILFLSLLSGRNPDYLIGHQVQAAEGIFKSNLEVIPTAYILLDGGKKSAVEYVSQTTPIPQDQSKIIRSTALAGMLMGMKCVFLDAGSGAKHPVSMENISMIKELGIPLIIGGGITSIEKVKNAHESGANLVVIGNKIEEEVEFLMDLKEYKTSKKCHL